MAKQLIVFLISLFLCSLCAALSSSGNLTCESCLAANQTLLIACKSNSNMTDLCADEVVVNCTLKVNCSAEKNHSNESTSILSPTPSTSLTPSSISPSLSASSSAISSSVKPSPSPKPTSKPPTPTKGSKPAPSKSGRRFDAASFIGGILLCGGVILLVYIAVRCYKSKPDYSRL